MIDGHMHLEYGDLSKEYILEFVKTAKEKGIKHIQILDHTHRFKEFECIYKDLKVYPVQKLWLENRNAKFKNTLDEYMVVINEVKSLSLDIDVKFGLEVCYVPDFEQEIKNILNPYTFDFLVGAIHSIDGILYDMPFSKQILWEVKPVNDIYKRYYELVYALIESNLFTQLAHPDTIKLFECYPSYDLNDTYKELAILLNKHHMKAENNTGCYYRYNHPDMGLSDNLLNIFKKYNVDIITCSDAHKPSDVGSYIKEVTAKINA